MTTKKTIKKLKRIEKKTKLERNIFFISSTLFFLTVIINIIDICYSPYLINGLILEINILMIFLCGYLFIKKQQKLALIADEKIELKIKYILEQS